MVEHEGYGASLGKIAAVLGEDRAHFACRAIAVVSQSLDDHCDPTGAITLVADFVVAFSVGALRLLDCAVNVIFRHVLGPRREHGGPEPRIECRVRQAELGRYRYFTCKFAEQLGARLILAALAMHNVLELGMTSHKENARGCCCRAAI